MLEPTTQLPADTGTSDTSLQGSIPGLGRTERPAVPAGTIDPNIPLGEARARVEAAATAEPAKPAATPASDKPAEPAGLPKMPKVGDHFKALKAKQAEAAQTWEQEKVTLTARITKLETEELAGTIKERDELRAELRALDITRDPEFQMRFKGRRETYTRLARNAAGSELSAKLGALLEMPASNSRETQIEALLEGVNDGSKRLINAALNNLANVEVEEAAEMDMARQNWQQRERQRDQQRVVQDASRKQAFEDELSEWVKQGVDVLKLTGDAKADAPTKELLDTARTYFTGRDLDDRGRANMALRASLSEVAFQQINLLTAERDTIAAKLARYEASTPGDNTPSGNGSGSDTRITVDATGAPPSVAALARSMERDMNAPKNTFSDARRSNG